MVSFIAAQKCTIPFGKFKDKTLDEVASSDEGLRYLDWLRGQKTYGYFGTCLEVYMSDPTIKREVERVIEDQR